MVCNLSSDPTVAEGGCVRGHRARLASGAAGGARVLIVAPLPRNREADPPAYEVDYERIAAFVLEPGQAALIDRSTGHNMVSLATECMAISVTKNHGTGITQLLDVIEGRTGQLQSTVVIEYVYFGEGDQRLIELEL